MQSHNKQNGKFNVYTILENQISLESKNHTLLLKDLFDTCILLYSSQSSTEYVNKISGIHNSAKYFTYKIEDMENKYGLDKKFLNEFIILKLKAMTLLARATSLTINSVEDYESTMSLYMQPLDELGKYLLLLDCINDHLLQEEIYHCIKEVTGAISRKKIQYNNTEELQKLIYAFSEKCRDNIVKLNLQCEPVANIILSNKTNKMDKMWLRKTFIATYDNYAATVEKSRNEGMLDIETRMKYTASTLRVFQFIEKTHPALRIIKIESALLNKNKNILNNYFKIYNDIKDTYLKKMIDLLCEIEEDLLKVNVIAIADIRIFGKDLVKFFMDHKVQLSQWNKTFDENDDPAEIEESRRSIIQLYKYIVKIYSFYNKFFEKHPEQYYCNISSNVALLSSEHDFQQSMQSIEELDQFINNFKKEEIIRDALFQEEKQHKLKISEESALFLIELEKKEEKFRLNRLNKRRNKEIDQSSPPLTCTSIQEIDDESGGNELTKPAQEIPYSHFDQAGSLISRHKYTDAIIAYELAYDHAKQNQDVYSELRALDGLSITHGNLILKSFSSLLVLLKLRLSSSSPLKRNQRISLEISIKDITFKFNFISNLYCDLINLSQCNNLRVGKKTRTGIEFGKNLIRDIIRHLKSKITEIRTTYNSLITKTKSERESFILKLATDQTSHSGKKMTKPQLMKLGLRLYSEIGDKKIEKNEDYSDHTNERILLDELNHYLKYLSNASDIILSSSLEYLQSFIKNPDFEFAHLSKSKLVKSSMTVILPIGIQKMFSHLGTFSKQHCLYGSTVLDLISKEKCLDLIRPKDADYITTCDDKKMIASAVLENERVKLSTIEGNIFTFMANRIFTISTLFCIDQGDGTAIIHDLTGRGFRDLDQMRLVMIGDPNMEFTKDPTSILYFIKYCLRGFHPEMNIILALKNLKLPENDSREYFDAIAKKELALLDYPDRRKYVKLFIRYGVLKKLFNINYEFNLDRTVAELERQLDVPALPEVTNRNRLFSIHNTLENMHIIAPDQKLSLRAVL